MTRIFMIVWVLSSFYSIAFAFSDNQRVYREHFDQFEYYVLGGAVGEKDWCLINKSYNAKA